MIGKDVIVGEIVDFKDVIVGEIVDFKDVIVGEIVDFEEDYFNTEFWCRVEPETVGQLKVLSFERGVNHGQRFCS